MRNYLPKLKSLMLALVLMIGTVVIANAQNRSISGTVLDASLGDPVPGATVLVKGTTRGAATDLDGKFTLQLQPGDQILVVSFVGYLTQEVEIGNQSVLTINLKEDIQSLQEAVVIGYGSQDKKEITSAVVGVKPDDFNRGNVTNPTQLLQGKVAGLSITRPGGNPNAGFNIRLRGLSTFGANSSPLIVLDGVIGASLENVDPNDIQSIDVLKDGSAAAIYGARGSSGVILITTTKQGKKEGTTNVTINSFGTLDQATNLIPVLSAEEFIARGGTDFGSNTDWRNELISDALSFTTNASVSGSFDNTSYMASVNYRDNNGIVNGVGNERLNTRLNLSQGALNNTLRFNINLSFTNVDSESINDAAFRYATIYNPTAPIFENTDLANQRFGGYFQRDLFDFFNPVALARQQRFVGETKTALTSYKVEYDILPNLTVTAQYSQDRRNTLSGGFWAIQDYQVGFGSQGSAERNTFDRSQRIFESTLRYETDLTSFYTSANATTCQAKNMFDGSTNKVFSDSFILLLIKWHKQDPVSAKEIAQNNAIYNFQGNRNPFIDNPNYVCDIWITQCNTVDILSSESFAFENTISIYPNPAINNEVTISSETELKSIVLYNINGQIIQEIKNPTRVDNSYKVNNLSSGFYLVQLASENGVATKKVIVN